MRHPIRLLGLALAPMLLSPIIAARAAEPVYGRYVTQNKKAVVQIEPCGNAVCGRVIKLLPASDVGKTMDERNKDAGLRTRPLVGLPILLGFVADGDQWRGKVYDPQSGDTYTSTMARYPDGALKVRGCFFFICKTQRWPRAD